jgi:arylsulfatase A-like enzyme
VVLGTLREEGLLDRTIILFLADHGDMLGNHGLWAKRLYYEDSACVPMILRGLPGDARSTGGRTDNRLVGLQDVMPTLLDMAGIDIPGTVDGLSMVGQTERELFYGEYAEGSEATRMLHDGRHKLIYYAAGNRLQLFDLERDPRELEDLVEDPAYSEVRQRLTQRLKQELYGSDEWWLDREGNLVGLPEFDKPLSTDRTLALQRGSHWPVPPQTKGK